MNIEVFISGVASGLYLFGYFSKNNTVKMFGAALAFLVCAIVVWKHFLGVQ